ncbi:tape measure protein [Pantoea phage vB_PagS_Vid5]|uniref:Tape measure protein n=1 Tax=Pantoea phage vB_PagS_Vid5 TaxID=2099652 RepID=A0A2P1CKJ3_9CAUD|nr:tail length tape measure protein [Pantoea phage vB_PagS_Vid5]AVJ51773.1 tape measure protein [Pantoea phage vB_PagS_Vid5]
MSDLGLITVRIKTDGVATADAALRSLGRTGDGTQRSVTGLSQTFNTASGSASGLTTSAGRLEAALTGLVSLSAIKQLAELSDTWTVLTNKLELARKANESVSEVQQRVFEIAQASRTDLSATATLYSRLERAMRNTGKGGAELGRIVETVNKAMVVSGATSAESSAALIQFSQAMASGVLRGDEFRSVAEQAPRLTQLLSDALGVGIGKLRELAYSGQLTADVVIKALERASDTIDKEFSRTLPTFSQNWTIATNNVVKFFGESDKGRAAVVALGSAIVSLSENLDTVTIAAGALATILTARLITSIQQKTVASVLAYKADMQMAAQQKATNAVMQSSVGVMATKASADRAAAATALQLARAEVVVAKAAGDATAAKVALTAATVAHRTAVIAEITAKQNLGVALENASVSMSRFNGVMAVGRGLLGLLGGPLGVIMLAAAGWAAYSQANDVAVKSANDFADSADTVIDRLGQMTKAQRDATAARAADELDTLVENNGKLSDSVNEITLKLEGQRAMQSQVQKGTATWNDWQKEIDQSTRALAKAVEELEANQRRQANAQNIINSAQNDAIPILDEIISQYQRLHQVGATIEIGDVAGDLQKKLSDASRDLDVVTMKAAGNGKQSKVYSELIKDLGKSADQWDASAKRAASGQLTMANAANDSERALVKLAAVYGKTYEAQEKISGDKKAKSAADRNAKAMETNAQRWAKSYERITASGADALAKLSIQQASELRIMEQSGAKAQASQEQLAQARLSIEEKYAKLRQDLVDKYSSERKTQSDYNEQLKDIQALESAKLLTTEQAARARADVEGKYMRAQRDMVVQNAVSQKDQLKATYDPLQEAQNQYTQQLALLEWYHQQGLVSEENYAKERSRLYGVNLQNQMNAQNQTTMSYLDSASTMAGSFASVLAAAGDQSSGAYKAMFAMSKAFAIAEATMKLSVAIAQAMADPTAITPAQKFANYATVAASGAALINSIMSASMTGMAHDGITDIPKEGTWLLQKGERVLSAQQNADFTNYMKGNNNSNSGTSGKGVTIVQHIAVNGNGDKALTQAMQKAAQDGADMGYAKSVADVTTNRGQISRAIGR